MSQYRTLTSSPAWLGTDGLSWDSARSGEQQWAVGSGRRGGLHGCTPPHAMRWFGSCFRCRPFRLTHRNCLLRGDVAPCSENLGNRAIVADTISTRFLVLVCIPRLCSPLPESPEILSRMYAGWVGAASTARNASERGEREHKIFLASSPPPRLETVTPQYQTRGSAPRPHLP